MADSDTLAPILTGLTLPFISVSDGGASATFGASATDQGSGVASVRLTLDHPLISGGGAVSTLSFGNWSAGTSASATLAIDASTTAGTYQIVQAAVSDAAGNVTTYAGTGLQAAGIASSFTVQSRTPTDTTAPGLTAVSASTYSGRGGDLFLQVAAGAGDGGSGVRQVAIHLDHAIQTSAGTVDTLLLADSHDPYDDGQSTILYGISPQVTPGTYAFTEVDITDKAGNIASYDAAALARFASTHSGVATSFTIADTTRPVLTRISLPTTIDVSQGTASATFSATATDAGGIGSITFDLSSGESLVFGNGFTLVIRPGTGGGRLGPAYDPVQVTESRSAIALLDTGRTYPYPSGADSWAVNGDTYSVTTPLRSLTIGGTYEVARVIVSDKAGNSSTYQGDQLTALGATSFTVKGDQTAPTLAGLTLPDHVVAGAAFQVVAVANDPASGAASASISFDHPLTMGPITASSSQIAGLDPYAAPPAISFSTTATASAYGRYTIGQLTLTDQRGNAVTYSGDQLKALGFDPDTVVLRPPGSDFTGDFFSDILWQHRGGAVSTWSGSSTSSVIQSTYNSSVDPSWHAVETLDWNNDAHADVLWRNDNGEVAIWNGTATGLAPAYLDRVTTDWKIVATGDFNGDGKSDILWQNSNGSLTDWLSAGTSFSKSVWSHGAVGGGWTVAGSGDFNGDGWDDILWRNADGAVSTWNGNAGGAGTTPSFDEASTYIAGTPASWHIVGIGDFDADGKSDLLWRNDNGAVSVWEGTANGFVGGLFNAFASTDWRVAQVGDFNGDGRADILWRNTDGAVSIWQSTGSGWTQNSYYDGSVGTDWSIAAHVFA